MINDEEVYVMLHAAWSKRGQKFSVISLGLNIYENKHLDRVRLPPGHYTHE